MFSLRQFCTNENLVIIKINSYNIVNSFSIHANTKVRLQRVDENP